MPINAVVTVLTQCKVVRPNGTFDVEIETSIDTVGAGTELEAEALCTAEVDRVCALAESIAAGVPDEYSAFFLASSLVLDVTGAVSVRVEHANQCFKVLPGA